MISLDVFAPTQLHIAHPIIGTDGINRVFAAAVVDRYFCEALLRAPEQTLAHGYLGQSFLLSKQEKALIISIHAETLIDLAKQVHRVIAQGY
jgi:hypothetical protein